MFTLPIYSTDRSSHSVGVFPNLLSFVDFSFRWNCRSLPSITISNIYTHIYRKRPSATTIVKNDIYTLPCKSLGKLYNFHTTWRFSEIRKIYFPISEIDDFESIVCYEERNSEISEKHMQQFWDVKNLNSIKSKNDQYSMYLLTYNWRIQLLDIFKTGACFFSEISLFYIS